MRATVGRIYWTARFLGWAVPQPVSQSATLRLLLTLEAGVEWTKCSSSSMIMDYHTFGTIKMLLGQNKRRKGWRSQRWITPACFASSLDRLDRRRPTPFPYLERRERRGPERWNLCCKNISSGADRPSSTGRVQQRFPIRLVGERKVHIRSRGRSLDSRKLAGLAIGSRCYVGVWSASVVTAASASLLDFHDLSRETLLVITDPDLLPMALIERETDKTTRAAVRQLWAPPLYWRSPLIAERRWGGWASKKLN